MTLEARQCFGYSSPFSETLTPPRVVFANSVKLGKVVGYEPNCMTIRFDLWNRINAFPKKRATGHCLLVCEQSQIMEFQICQWLAVELLSARFGSEN